MFELFLSTIVLSAFYVSVTAAAAHSCGVGIKEISYGTGKKLLTFQLVSIRVLLFGGFVQMEDSRNTEKINDLDIDKAFNHKPLWIQLIIPLSGIIFLASFSFVILDAEWINYFVVGFKQVFLGAISPFETAQVYLDNILPMQVQHSTLEFFAIVSAKLAALNALPFSLVNGGQILIILAKRGQPHVSWEDSVVQWLAWPLLLMMFLWFLAGTYFVIRLF